MLKSFHFTILFERPNCVILYIIIFRVDVLRMEKNGYELIREGMKVVESEVGMSSNRETIAKSKLSKMLTMTSVDFEENAEIIGTSELMNFEDMFTIGKLWLFPN